MRHILSENIEMVVQKSWSNAETSFQNDSTSETSTITTWAFQTPAKTVNVKATQPCTVQSKQPITRQLAINTLAAMHRRFSLPGPVQPHSRPIAEFRASANKSLDILRQTIQSAVTREIDQVIKKYLEKFFVPAVNNIRLNLGDDSVSEDQVRAVCRAMLDATRLLYTTPSKPTPSPFETTENDSNYGVDTKYKQNNMHSFNKRKDSDIESDVSFKRKKIKEEGPDSGSSSPLPPMVFRDPEKWNPARLTHDTLFIMGSHAHKVLGLGNCRGRLYTRHAGLLRYPADSADKEWIASHNLVNVVGGKTYIMVLEDIEELATSEAYKHNSLPMLGELTGFKVPPFMLRKIKAYVTKRALSGDISNPDSPQPSTSFNQTDDKSNENIKIERETDSNFNQYITNADVTLNKDDFPDIKVEDLDEIKVDGIKVEDLDVDNIKVENIDDINVDDIKVEDIKLEYEDAFDNCKDTDEEDSHLVDGLLESDIEFLSRNLGNIESDADARKTIEKLTGANPDTITLVGDEFDLGSTLNTNYSNSQKTKCITVASTTSGMVHSVPVAHLAPSALHYYTAPRARTVHHLPAPTLTIQGLPASTAHLIRGIPINTKSGTFSTVMSQGTASAIIGFGTRSSNATIIGTPQYVNVTSKSFPTGNILHNAIVSRNIINRANLAAAPSGVSFNVTAVRPVIHTTASKISTTSCSDFNSVSTSNDMIDNACNSSVMLKKVLTLGSAGAAKSFMMHNTQKVLSTGFANGVTPPPNVTIVSSGSSNVLNTGRNCSGAISPSIKTTLSATHATLSALLAPTAESAPSNNN